LNEILDELGRLKQFSVIPKRIQGVGLNLQVKAFNILEALLDLTGEQLTYLKTFGKKFGPMPVKLTT
jgi:hypothetical protein